MHSILVIEDMSEIKYLDCIGMKKLRESSSGRDRYIINLLFDTGMRVSELVETRVSDIDLEHRFIRIGAERSKTHKSRSVRISPGMADEIRANIQPGQEYLLPGRSSRHLNIKTVERIVDRAAQRAGLQEVDSKNKLHRKKVVPHTLRHSHAVEAILSGVSLPSVSKNLGHARLSTTEIYLNLAPKAVQDDYSNHNFGGEHD